MIKLLWAFLLRFADAVARNHLQGKATWNFNIIEIKVFLFLLGFS